MPNYISNYYYFFFFFYFRCSFANPNRAAARRWVMPFSLRWDLPESKSSSSHGICSGPSSDLQSLCPTCFLSWCHWSTIQKSSSIHFKQLSRFISSTKEKRTCRLCLRTGFQAARRNRTAICRETAKRERDFSEWRPSRPIMFSYSRKQRRTDLRDIKQSPHRTADPF